LLGMLDAHLKQRAMHTYLEGVPSWLGGEIYQRADLLDAFTTADRLSRLDSQPGEFIRSMPDKFKSFAHNPRISRRWKRVELSLANPASAAIVKEVIMRAPNPIAVSYRDFIE